MEWPLLWDPFNLLELPAVPITLILDPDGVIRLIQPTMDRVEAIAEYLQAPHGRSAQNDLSSPVPGVDAMQAPATGDPTAWSDHAAALALWGGERRLDEAVAASEAAVAEGGSAVAWFRRGVVLRLRHDSPYRQDNDFASATEAWSNALQVDPDNYIWRRRLQQYGPRLAKPYAFYDWVGEARSEILARGGTLPVLAVEPVGAEFASPAEADESPVSAAVHPDPDGRITADSDRLIGVRVGVVPSRVPPGDAARVHIDMVPDADRSAHWNNEAGTGVVWVAAPDDWRFEPRLQELVVPPEPTSDEIRHIEIEVGVPPDCDPGTHRVDVVFLYNICEDQTGVCLFRRRDVSVEVVVDSNAVSLRL